MHKILIIEDDPLTAEEIISALQGLDYIHTHVNTLEQAAKETDHVEYDVITLDRMLPDGDGLQLLQGLRKREITTPVLMISALSDLDERVKGLRAGGDDYLTKPFASIEMIARLEALLRRNQSAQTSKSKLVYFDLELDLINRRVRRDKNALELQPIEFKLLEYLMRCAEQIVTRTMIFEAIWGYQFDPGTNVIDVHMGKLRRKVDSLGMIPLIHTVRGSGFIFGKPPE